MEFSIQDFKTAVGEVLSDAQIVSKPDLQKALSSFVTKNELRSQLKAVKKDLREEILAAKAEMDALSLELRVEIDAVRQELQVGLQAVKVELRAEIKSFKEEMQEQIKSSTTDLAQNMTDIMDRVWEQFRPLKVLTKRHTKVINQHSGELVEHTFLLKEHDRTFLNTQTTINKLLTEKFA